MARTKKSAAAPTPAQTVDSAAVPSTSANPTTPRPKVTLSDAVRCQIIEKIIENHHHLFHQKWSQKHKNTTWGTIFKFSQR